VFGRDFDRITLRVSQARNTAEEGIPPRCAGVNIWKIQVSTGGNNTMKRSLKTALLTGATMLEPRYGAANAADLSFAGGWPPNSSTRQATLENFANRGRMS
jgi:hypothetical protein